MTNYTSHWKRWAAFIGAATPIDSVTLIHCTKFRKELSRVGVALNQARLNLKLVQLVYRWGQRADLVRSEGVLKFRWTKNKDDKQPLEPAEYTDDQFERLLRNGTAASRRVTVRDVTKARLDEWRDDIIMNECYRFLLV